MDKLVQDFADLEESVAVAVTELRQPHTQIQHKPMHPFINGVNGNKMCLSIPENMVRECFVQWPLSLRRVCKERPIYNHALNQWRFDFQDYLLVNHVLWTGWPPENTMHDASQQTEGGTLPKYGCCYECGSQMVMGCTNENCKVEFTVAQPVIIKTKWKLQQR